MLRKEMSKESIRRKERKTSTEGRKSMEDE